MKKQFVLLTQVLITVLSLSLACCSFLPSPASQSESPQASLDPSAGLTSTLTPALPTASPEPTGTPPSPPFTTWVDPALPLLLRQEIANSSFFDISAAEDTATVIVSGEPSSLGGYWLYLVAAPYYDHTEGVSSAELQSCWRSGVPASAGLNRLLVSENTLAALSLSWGPPAEGCVTASQNLEDELWLDPGTLAVMPFEDADPSLRILPVDGQDPLGIDFSLEAYPLRLPYYFHASSDLQSTLGSAAPLSNFNSAKLTSLALTGVTAMVRDTASIMEREGITYPGEDVQPILVNADITHISNEVPFAEDCPAPQSSQPNLVFCSDDRYIDLLSFVGTDIVELDGDHFSDWGPEAMLHTMDLYEGKGWLTYGGGRTLQEGLEPVFLTVNGNRFAFLGCNGKSLEGYATASDTEPGAARCDFDWMIPEVQKLASESYIVIVTMQHEEVSSYGSIAWQRRDFRALADAGATIVSGSQAHHPQGFEMSQTAFIHYGLGNLFFDQWYLAQSDPNHADEDKAFIDLHYFYDGRYISTRLIPLQFIDNARPRLMTPAEGQAFLDQVYQYSLREGKWVNLYQSGFYRDFGDQ